MGFWDVIVPPPCLKKSGWRMSILIKQFPNPVGRLGLLMCGNANSCCPMMLRNYHPRRFAASVAGFIKMTRQWMKLFCPACVSCLLSGVGVLIDMVLRAFTGSAQCLQKERRDSIFFIKLGQKIACAQSQSAANKKYTGKELGTFSMSTKRKGSSRKCSNVHWAGG